MRVLVPVLLGVVTLLDGCFAGFRAAAGMDARTDKRRYARAACAAGTRAGVVVLALLAAYCLSVLAVEPERYGAFVRAGARMLLVLGPYALLVLLALAVYATVPRTGVQTLSSTLVLGPFTLARPLVVLVAVLVGSVGAAPAVAVGVGLSGALVLAVEPALRRRPPPDVPPTPAPWASG